jgi:hypothetical protein
MTLAMTVEATIVVDARNPTSGLDVPEGRIVRP